MHDETKDKLVFHMSISLRISKIIKNETKYILNYYKLFVKNTLSSRKIGQQNVEIKTQKRISNLLKCAVKVHNETMT